MNKSVKQVIADFEFSSIEAREKANKCLPYSTAQAQVFELCNQLDYAVNNSNNLVSELESKTDKFETDLKQVLITSNKLGDELTKANDTVLKNEEMINGILSSKLQLTQDRDNLIIQNTQLITELNEINSRLELRTIKLNTKSSFKIKLINLINR